MRFISLLKACWSDREGAVLLLVGLGLLVLLVLGGAGVDMGRAQLIHAKLQQATDGAGVAYAALPDTATTADRTAAANRYYALNFPASYLGITRPALSVTPVGSGGVRVSTATVNLPTIFVHFLPTPGASGSREGIDYVPIAASTTINNNASSVAYDLVLAIDNSGSMAYGDVGATPTRPGGGAAHNNAVQLCIDTWAPIYATSPYTFDPSIRCGLSDDVYPGLGITNNSRLNAVYAAADTVANQLLNVSRTGSRVGVVTWSTHVIGSQPLVSNYPTIKGALDNMFAFGATNSMEGLQQAQNLLASPMAGHVAAVVLLTDGFNTTTGLNLHYDGSSPTEVYDDAGPLDGGHCTTNDVANDEVTRLPVCATTNESSKNVCQALKDRNVVIYTIAFGTDVTSGSQAAAAQDFLKQCASGDPATNRDQFFFVAPNAATLNEVFSKILVSLKKIRIAN